jgi:DNA adenine methylase
VVNRARSPRPFIPWVGGKTVMLPSLHSLLPARMNRYVEPFVGGGALFFAVDASRERVIADINEHLINAYREVARDAEAVIGHLEGVAAPVSAAEYRSLADAAVASSTGPRQAALFIATVKSTFGAKWEIDPSGKHRGTWSKKKVNVCDPRGLHVASHHLRGAQIECGHFKDVLDASSLAEGDLVYLDPPYLPEAEGTFTSYSKDDFGFAEHVVLAGLIDDLSERGVYVMLSMNDTPAARETYRSLDLRTAPAPRRLRPADRAGVDLIGLNYPMPG